MAPHIAVVAFIIGSIGVGGSGTGLNTDEILQKQPNSCAGQQATGAVSCSDIASMAIGVTDQTLVRKVHTVLAIGAGQGAVGRSVDQVVYVAVEVLALGATEVVACKTECASPEAAYTGIVGCLPVVAVRTDGKALVAVLVVGHPAHVITGLTVECRSIASQARS